MIDKMSEVKPDPNRAYTSCRHDNTQIYRQPFADGGGAHLIELCLDCGANPRGPGRWVPRSEAITRGLDPDALPIAPNSERAQQPSLFDGAEGGA
jgi:hypothetical protein